LLFPIDPERWIVLKKAGLFLKVLLHGTCTSLRIIVMPVGKTPEFLK
jgi:hypothetical protein